VGAEHDQDVIQMNEVRCCASGQVQRAAPKVEGMIDEPGHPTGHSRSPLKEEKAMLKTISAALLAVSVLAAPALAAGTGITAQAPVTKSAVTNKSAVTKSTSVKPSALNANAKMGRHHVKHSRHHRFHKKMAVGKAHQSSKIAVKHVTHPAKRG
jgi:hypothetical protein